MPRAGSDHHQKRCTEDEDAFKTNMYRSERRHELIIIT